MKNLETEMVNSVADYQELLDVTVKLYCVILNSTQGYVNPHEVVDHAKRVINAVKDSQ